MSLFAELKRRKVLRVALLYSGVAWLLLIASAATADFLGLPEWLVTTSLFLCAMGFPVALVLAWSLANREQTRISDSTVDPSNHYPPLTRTQLWQMILTAVFVLSVGFLYLDRLRVVETSPTQQEESILGR